MGNQVVAKLSIDVGDRVIQGLDDRVTAATACGLGFALLEKAACQTLSSLSLGYPQAMDEEVLVFRAARSTSDQRFTFMHQAGNGMSIPAGGLRADVRKDRLRDHAQVFSGCFSVESPDERHDELK
jgi:hypothetical protein